MSAVQRACENAVVIERAVGELLAARHVTHGEYAGDVRLQVLVGDDTAAGGDGYARVLESETFNVRLAARGDKHGIGGDGIAVHIRDGAVMSFFT